MKTLYLDILSGISGDMLIGAMLDLGVDAHQLEQELEKLGLREYHLHVSRQERGGISGTKFDVHLTHKHSHEHAHTHEHSHGEWKHTHAHSHIHSHEHEHPHGEDHGPAHEHAAQHHDHLKGKTHGPHGGPLLAHESNRRAPKSGQIEVSVFETGLPPRFRLYFFDEHGHHAKPMAEKNVTLETVREGGQRQRFRFKNRGEYLEATDELPEPHEFRAVLRIKRGARVEKLEMQFVEDHHHHHDAGLPVGAPQAHGRTFTEIRTMIQRSKLSPWVKEKAVAVFQRVANAEGKIHGQPSDRVHFHEVGAVDSIVDIVGGCIALELLGKPRVLAGPVLEGTGTVNCAHGCFPLPAPATLEILGARGVTLQQCDEPSELITPTGAAFLAEFAESFGPMRDLSVSKIGYGLGTRQNKTRPNVLRVVLGESTPGIAAHDWETDTILVLETNLDDINPEILGGVVEKALAGGALDVFHTPIQMKKNRPGVLLTILCRSADGDRFTEFLLRETSAFGVRRHATERRKLKREIIKVQTSFGEIAVKVGRLDGAIVQAAPEFESCKELAEQANVPLKRIYDEAVRALQT